MKFKFNNKNYNFSSIPSLYCSGLPTWLNSKKNSRINNKSMNIKIRNIDSMRFDSRITSLNLTIDGLTKSISELEKKEK